MTSELKEVRGALEYTIDVTPNWRISNKCEEALTKLDSYIERQEEEKQQKEKNFRSILGEFYELTSSINLGKIMQLPEFDDEYKELKAQIAEQKAVDIKGDM